MERLRRPDWNSRWYIRPPALLIMIREKTPLVLEGILVAVRFNEQTDGAYMVSVALVRTAWPEKQGVESAIDVPQCVLVNCVDELYN